MPHLKPAFRKAWRKLSASNRRVKRLALALLASVAVLAVAAASAGASSATVSLKISGPDAQGYYEIDASGVVPPAGAYLGLYGLSGTNGCPATDADAAALVASAQGGPGEVGLYRDEAESPATGVQWADSASWGPMQNGVFWICAYLVPAYSPTGYPGQPLATAAAPLGVGVPTPPTPTPPAKHGASVCVVPRVLGTKLAAARKALAAADCRAGKISRRRSSRASRGRVISQSPRAGRHRPAGASVNLTVGR
jgi:hypothetical protein